MWKTALVLLQAILLQVVAQEEQIQCVGSDVFRTSNGSCSSCQSLSCPEGYEPNQNCGNGLPLEGGHCVQCINSSKFSKYGDRCYPCSICVERVVAVRCNGVNDTVCGDTCNVGYFQEGNRCISCSLHLNPDQHEECASSTVRVVKDEDPTIQLLSKSGEDFKKPFPFVVYVFLILCIVLIFLVLILCYVCCCTGEEQACLKYGPCSRREENIDVEIQPEALLQQSGQADEGNVQREEVIDVERQQEIALLQQNGQADEGNDVHGNGDTNPSDENQNNTQSDQQSSSQQESSQSSSSISTQDASSQADDEIGRCGQQDAASSKEPQGSSTKEVVTETKSLSSTQVASIQTDGNLPKVGGIVNIHMVPNSTVTIQNGPSPQVYENGPSPPIYENGPSPPIYEPSVCRAQKALPSQSPETQEVIAVNPFYQPNSLPTEAQPLRSDDEMDQDHSR